jgi:cellulose synthase/poly-beta-1,6-N-acetylglucosamine synthase-like glycosyltransferase
MIAIWGLALLCLVAALRTLLIACRYAQLFKQDMPPDAADYAPLVRVVLCLRGGDPFLRDCIAGLLAQDYDRYELMIVVDSVDDPAWAIAQEAVADADVPVTVKPLQVRSKHRSLLMSSVLEAVSDLSDDCQAIAIADADVITSANWLRSLVAPLRDPQVGAATGIRWCVPESSEWGTTVRYLWNSFAEPQRHTHQIPWGGSLAIRRDVLDIASGGRFWQRAFCADLTLTPILAERRLRVQIVPEATSAVRETISFWPCLSFLTRQMTWVRLYHPRWLAILADSLLLALPAVLGALSLLIFVLLGEFRNAAIIAGVCGAFGAALCVTHFWVEHCVFRVIRRHGGSTSSPLAAWIKCFVAAPLLPPLYFLCAIYAHFRRQVSWRGIRYSYRGPWDIEVQNDEPFQQTNEQQTASMV